MTPAKSSVDWNLYKDDFTNIGFLEKLFKRAGRLLLFLHHSNLLKKNSVIDIHVYVKQNIQILKLYTFFGCFFLNLINE